MPMAASEIEALIKAHLPGAEVRIDDLRGDGDHYLAHVSSSAFRGKSRVQQHQMVYEALKGRVGEALHALALQTTIPATTPATPPRGAGAADAKQETEK